MKKIAKIFYYSNFPKSILFHFYSRELNDKEVKPGKCIGVIPSVDNRKLWVSGIPKNRTADEIKDEMSKLTDGVTSVFIYSHPIDKSKTRGYAFIEYESHRAAALARRKLVPGKYRTMLYRAFL